MGFKRGDSVTVVLDSYLEQGGRSFVGSTGTVSGVDGDQVAVRLDGDSRSTGFTSEEVERKR